jgi:hypothetical protein
VEGPAFLVFIGLVLVVATVFAQIFQHFPLYLNARYGLKEPDRSSGRSTPDDRRDRDGPSPQPAEEAAVASSPSGRS